jgi:hypothetical protein
MDAIERRAAETVRYFRPMGFFQNTKDYGFTTLDNGPTPHGRGIPLPAHAIMTDEEIGRLIIGHYRKSFRREFDYEGPIADVLILRYDPFRVYNADLESAEKGAYVEELQSLACISRGSFNPTEMSEWWEGDSGDPVHLYLVFQGREYEIVLTDTGDWIDTSYIHSINALLVLSGAPYRFCHYDFQGWGQHQFVVALTPEEKQRIEREREWRFHENIEPGGALIDKGVVA